MPSSTRMTAISRMSGFLQVRENWKRSGNLSDQGKSGKCQSDWEMLGKCFTFSTVVVMLIIAVSLESNPAYCHSSSSMATMPYCYIERGFSVNKELVVENQSERTLAARRIIRDHIIRVNGVTNVEITRNMVVAALNARASYASYLAQQKEEQETEKRKRRN